MPTTALWCPDNRHIYVVRDDNRLLRDFWVINSLEDSPSLIKYKYEFQSDKYVTQNELAIIDIVEKTVKKAKIDKWKDQYIRLFMLLRIANTCFLNVLNVLGMK